jgi:hypothetical protein
MRTVNESTSVDMKPPAIMPDKRMRSIRKPMLVVIGSLP